ncbi:MAG: acyl-CoA thioesterase [Myxococcota bacterium]
MTYLFRTMLAYLRARFVLPRARIHRTERRVGLFEIDTNVHMNQRVYPEVAELSRLEWFVSSGLWERMRSQGINPVVAEQHIAYRRELAPFARYTIDTRPVAVKGRLMHVQHWFVVGDRVHTRIDVMVLFIGPDGVLSPEAVEALITPELQAPLPVEGWQIVRN